MPSSFADRVGRGPPRTRESQWRQTNGTLRRVGGPRRRAESRRLWGVAFRAGLEQAWQRATAGSMKKRERLETAWVGGPAIVVTRGIAYWAARPLRTEPEKLYWDLRDRILAANRQ